MTELVFSLTLLLADCLMFFSPAWLNLFASVEKVLLCREDFSFWAGFKSFYFLLSIKLLENLVDVRTLVLAPDKFLPLVLIFLCSLFERDIDRDFILSILGTSLTPNFSGSCRIYWLKVSTFSIRKFFPYSSIEMTFY